MGNRGEEMSKKVPDTFSGGGNDIRPVVVLNGHRGARFTPIDVVVIERTGAEIHHDQFRRFLKPIVGRGDDRNWTYPLSSAQ